MHNSSNSVIELKTEADSIKIDVNKIKYIQSYGHYLIIKSQNKEWKMRGKISEAEEQLSSSDFVRIQNSVIVNCRFVIKVNSRELILIDGERIGISRQKANEVKITFQDFLRRGL